MKVKTLLKTLWHTEYVLMSESGFSKETNFIGDKYYGESNFEDSKVVRITTIKNNDVLYITIKD